MSGKSERTNTGYGDTEWVQTMDAMSEMIAILDTECRIRRANRALANRIGLSPEECVGLLCYRALHGLEAPIPECPFTKLLLDHKEHIVETHDERTGSDYLVTVSPLFDENAQLIGAIHVARDITAKKRSELAMLQSHSLLRATLDSTADGILVVDLNNRVVDFNDQFTLLWRIPEEILTQRDDEKALAFVRKQLKYPEQFFAKVQDLYAHPEADSFDLIEFIDGRVFERYSRPQLMNEKPVGRVWSFRDITDRKKAEFDLYHQMAFDAMATKFLARSARGSFAEVGGHIRASLEELGFFAEVDEVYVSILTANTWHVDHFWQASGAPGQIHRYTEPTALSHWLHARLRDGNTVQVHSLDDLPPEAARDRERLAHDGVVSLLMVPLRGKGGVVQGCLALRSYTRTVQWMPEDIHRMRLLGDAIATSLERCRSEMALCESETRLRTILENVQTGVIIVDAETHHIVDINRAAAALFGLPAEKLICENYLRFLRLTEKETFSATNLAASTTPSEDQLIRADGVCVSVLRTVVPMQLNNRVHILETLTDISVFKQMEERVLLSQKMDAIGRLAGGVAHDFNNIVQVIMGFSDILLLKLTPDNPHRQDVQEIKGAAMRAGDISRQLLSFSRSQSLAPTQLDINATLGENLKMLQTLLGVDIRVCTQLEPNLKRILADAGQISQVVLNLAANARDAMPRGGQLTIRTSAVTIAPYDTAMLTHPGAIPGDFVCLTVSDNGVGMTEYVRAHLFEPFFTTKERGKGTGLGLSVVYGIVKQCGGWICLDSRLNGGTAFHIYFPVCTAGRMAAKERDPAGELPVQRGHGENILLVEDDARIAYLTAQMLKFNNYQVVVCACTKDALARLQKNDAKLDMLFSDVVLPDHDGIFLADELRKCNEHMPILLCSGYTDERAQINTIREKGYHYLQKPYSSTDLLRSIQRLLKGE